mmetsp:Transcript_14007/g.42391  ORF Transcript_14007/g.42391 Transcript_14007/m.42391 type:complete len:204 (+) Transcript_14007:562-1173(+)
MQRRAPPTRSARCVRNAPSRPWSSRSPGPSRRRTASSGPVIAPSCTAARARSAGRCCTTLPTPTRSRTSACGRQDSCSARWSSWRRLRAASARCTSSCSLSWPPSPIMRRIGPSSSPLCPSSSPSFTAATRAGASAVTGRVSQLSGALPRLRSRPRSHWPTSLGRLRRKGTARERPRPRRPSRAGRRATARANAPSSLWARRA